MPAKPIKVLGSTIFVSSLLLLGFSNAQVVENESVAVTTLPVDTIKSQLNTPEDWLLQQVRMAIASYDDAFLQQSLEKLRQIAPDNPEGLKAQVYLNVRRNNLAQGYATLNELAQVVKESKAYNEAKLMLELAQPQNSMALEEARLYATAGQLGKAKEGYDALLKGVLPTLDLEVEYLQLLNRLPDNYGGIAARLAELDRDYPGNAALRLTLARLLLKEKQTTEAYDLLETMVHHPNTRSDAAKIWHDHLKTLKVLSDTPNQWQRFAENYQQEPLHSEVQAEIQRQRELLNTPSYQAKLTGLQRVAAGEGTHAIAELTQALVATPEDPELLGALGVAYVRANRRAEALDLFKRAQKLDVSARSGNKWERLIHSTEYWLHLKEGDALLRSQQFTKAQASYAAAHDMDDSSIAPLLGLGAAAFGLNQQAQAEAYYHQVLAQDASNRHAISGLAALYERQSPQKALQFLHSLPPEVVGNLRSRLSVLQAGSLAKEADRLIETGQLQQATHKLRQALSYVPTDVWLRYRLAKAYQAEGQLATADQLFTTVAHRQGRQLQFVYSYALFLSSSDRPAEAIALIKGLPQSAWNNNLRLLVGRLERQQSLTHANALRTAGDEAAAIAYLKAQPAHRDIDLLLANWALLRQDTKGAYTLYQQILEKAPNNSDAQLGVIETLVALKRLDEARAQLAQLPLPADSSLNMQRRYALAHQQVGDTVQANALLDALKTKVVAEGTTGESQALIFRDAARIAQQMQDPKQALMDYRQAMLQSDLVTQASRHTDALIPSTSDPEGSSPVVVKINRDDDLLLANDLTLSDEGFTYLTRLQPADDWLRRSIRQDASRLYQQQMPMVTMEQEYWGSSGTLGVSDLKAHTTMLHIEMPWRDGKAFFRSDYVQMNAGRFRMRDGDASQGFVSRYVENFGTCALGCATNIKQHQQGTSVAVGWDNARWHVDIGTTPLGFEVSDWVGGISYSGRLKKVGWTLTASRRPLSNSLLSFAGAQDPGTGITWGGARATGLNLSLSYDQGGHHGLWSSIDAHSISGRNLQKNNRLRFMGGYYYKLINEDHRRLSIGVNTMVWRYQHNASGYTLGQGGYYSPQQYFSVGIPVSYRQRTANWSFAVDASVSWSRSKTKDNNRYPMNLQWPGSAEEYCAAFSQCHISSRNYANFLNNRVHKGGTGGGFGYTLRTVVERRLDSNWRLGAGIDLRKAKDYTPSRGFIYLKYTFVPWQGDLDMAPKPLIPYADFK